MTRTRYPLRDVQQDPVVAYCSRCDGEIYADDAIMPGCLCRKCWEDENRETLRD